MLEETLDKDYIAKTNIRETIDKYAIASDNKDLKAYHNIFSPTIKLTVYFEGKLTYELEGLETMIEGLRPVLDGIKTQYHFNGQSIIKVNGNTATGITYNQTTHITEEAGKKYITKYSIRWEDIFEEKDGNWYIRERVSNTGILEKSEYKE